MRCRVLGPRAQSAGEPGSWAGGGQEGLRASIQPPPVTSKDADPQRGQVTCPTSPSKLAAQPAPGSALSQGRGAPRGAGSWASSPGGPPTALGSFSWPHTDRQLLRTFLEKSKKQRPKLPMKPVDGANKGARGPSGLSSRPEAPMDLAGALFRLSPRTGPQFTHLQREDGASCGSGRCPSFRNARPHRETKSPFVPCAQLRLSP